MSILNHNNRSNYNSRISVDENTVEALRLIAGQFAGRALFETRFSPEDQVLTHLIFENNIPIRVFTRTGRDQYEMLKNTVDQYGKAIELSFLQSELATQSFADQHPEQIVEWEAKPEIAPLHFVLQNTPVLLSSSRKEIPDGTPLRWEGTRERYVFNPLIYWTDNQVYAYILDNDIPHVTGSVPSLNENETSPVVAIPGWNGSFRKYLPQYSLVSGSFNIVHQIVAFFRLPRIANLTTISGN